MKSNSLKIRGKKESIHIMIDEIHKDTYIDRIYKLVEYLYRSKADK